MVCVNGKSSIDAKNAEFGAEMKDEWETLRKNVSEILKKDISIENVKHIAAVINVMENAGVDFKMPSEASYPQTTMPVEFVHPGSVLEFDTLGKGSVPDITKHIKYSVYDSPQHQAKRVTFEVTDQMLADMKPEQVSRSIHHELVAGICRALTDKIRWLKPWGDHSIKVSDKS